MFIIKTIIELFDACQIENVIAGLSFLPEKIVFVGFKETMTKRRINALESFFKLKCINMSLEFEIVGRYDYDAIYDKLSAIIDRNEDCCFDLTGGKELVLTAMGELSAIRNIPMIQFDIRSGTMIKVKNCENIKNPARVTMTINENVILNGGSIANRNDSKWDLNREFKKDIDILWDICRKDCKMWNKLSIALRGIEKKAEIDSENIIRIDLKMVSSDVREILMNNDILKELKINNLLTEYSMRNNILSFRYKNNQIRECLSKAGNILELFVYKTAHEITEESKEYYDDIDTGVVVDWDGILNDSNSSEWETRNEIDVVLMRDLVPVFISCKNGEVHKEALYELSAVAEKFGGEYAKKVIVTTYVSQDAVSRRYILQRAKDMNINILESVDKMDSEKFMKELKNRVK